MKVWHLVCIAALMLLVVAVVCSPSFRIRYHLNRMQAAHHSIHSEPSTVSSEGLVGYGSQELLERHDYHRDRLVDLGYYFHETYAMENIPVSGDEVHNTLWNLVRSSFPDSPLPTMEYPGNVLEVWDTPSRHTEWDQFVEKHNVSDFEVKFMTTEQVR